MKFVDLDKQFVKFAEEFGFDIDCGEIHGSQVFSVFPSDGDLFSPAEIERLESFEIEGIEVDLIKDEFAEDGTQRMDFYFDMENIEYN